MVLFPRFWALLKERGGKAEKEKGTVVLQQKKQVMGKGPSVKAPCCGFISNPYGARWSIIIPYVERFIAYFYKNLLAFSAKSVTL